MSVDPALVLNVAATAVVILILLVGVFRVFQMRRAFVNPVYRSRATWYALLMFTIMATNVDGVISTPPEPVYLYLSFLPFVVLILMIFGFVDRSVLVAMETDFFHRNTLLWRQFRWPMLVGLLVTVAAFFFEVQALSSLSGFPSLDSPLGLQAAFYLFLVALPLVLGYSTIALIVAARRTSDRVLKRSILILGIALSTFVVSLVATTPLTSGTLLYVIVNQAFTIPGIYLFYVSAMSMVPLARVREDESAAMLASPAQA